MIIGIVNRPEKTGPENVWLWSDRWQCMECETQSDLDSGRASEFACLKEALNALNQFDFDSE
jgi:hypothetical protein